MKRIIFSGIFLTLLLSVTAFAGPPSGLTDMERLGRHLYKDKNLSYNGTQSCQVCHHPFAGFADLRNAIAPETSVTSLGADGVSLGGRNAPTSGYAGFSPALSLVDGEWVGGLFRDGRADGSSSLQDPLAEQAQGPPLNPGGIRHAKRYSIFSASLLSPFFFMTNHSLTHGSSLTAYRHPIYDF